MSLASTLDALEKVGASSDVILAVVRAHLAAEDERLEARRVKDAARQRAKRSRDVTPSHAVSRGHAVTPTDTAPRTQVEDTSLPSLRSEEVVGGGGSASAIPVSDDWPSGKADHHAKLLVEAVASPWLDPNKSPDLVTTRGRVAAWKRDGASWEHDVLPVVTGLCANRRGRVSSWKFFDAAICRSIAENRAALEIPEARGNRPTGPPRTIDEKSSASWDYAIAKIAQDEQRQN